MKAIGLITTVLLVAALPASGEFYSNVLQNPGFETGVDTTNFSPWTQFNNAFRYSSATAQSGTHAIAMWGNWWPAGEWNASGVYQDYPAYEREFWEATVWAMQSSNVQGEAFAGINIEFLNAASQSIFSGISASRITASSPTNRWKQLKIRALSTRNTKYIRVKPMFLQSPAFEVGSVWFDDASLHRIPTNRLLFAGREWDTWERYTTPGPNYFSTNCVSVDTNGALHMRLEKIDGFWRCPTLSTDKPLGYGEYRWRTGSHLDRIDSNLVLGLFTYAQESVFGTNQNEVDIEVSHAFPGTETNCMLYTIQPYNIPGNGYQHPLLLTNPVSTHLFNWRPDEIHYQSFYGHGPAPETTNHVISEWRFRNRGIPIETNELCMMNLWLFESDAPINTQAVEVVIDDFVFTPFNGQLFADDFEDGVRSNAWSTMGSALPASAIAETNGSLTVVPGTTTNPAGYMTSDTIHRNERGEHYVFRADLATISVLQAKSGTDICSVFALFTETNGPVASGSAMALYGAYDSSTDALTFSLFTKTNTPTANGTLRFEGVLTNVTHHLADAPISLQIRMGTTQYAFRVTGSAASILPVSTNSGSAENVHELGEDLSYGYWLVGAQNEDGRHGSVSWACTSIGIDSPAEATEISRLSLDSGTMTASWTAAYDKIYQVQWTTNLAEPFQPLSTNLPGVLPETAFTNAFNSVNRAFYRLRTE